MQEKPCDLKNNNKKKNTKNNGKNTHCTKQVNLG